MSTEPKDGKPGTTDQSPRWEGPEETRPRGYLPAEDDPSNDKDAAGETLKTPDRKNLSDAFATKDIVQPSQDERPDTTTREEGDDVRPNRRP